MNKHYFREYATLLEVAGKFNLPLRKSSEAFSNNFSFQRVIWVE